MITPYYGEFLQNPVPLELSIGSCSHGCAYCFATAKPSVDSSSTKEVEAAMRWLATYHDKSSFEARLLQLGYPVVVSNRTDPFSRSGERDVLPIMEIMRDMDIPMMIQTKGGRKALDFAKTLKPSFWYVSLSFDPDHAKLCRQIEPGAPDPMERLDLVRKLCEMGHSVAIGWNPCVQDWVTDPAKFARLLKRSGACGVWLENLHLERKRLAIMGERRCGLLGDSLIQKACDKSRPLSPFLEIARECCKSEGLSVFSGFHWDRSDFWKPCQSIYEHTFPIWQDCINHLHDSVEPLTAIDGDWFANGFKRRLPNIPSEACCGHILASQSWKIATIPGYSNHMSLHEVVDFGMRITKSAFNPAKFWNIALAWNVGESGELVHPYSDDDGRPMYVWTKSKKEFDYYNPI